MNKEKFWSMFQVVHQMTPIAKQRYPVVYLLDGDSPLFFSCRHDLDDLSSAMPVQK